MRNICVLAGRIDHKEQMITAIGEHKIIQNAALIIGEQAIALPPFAQPGHIHRHQFLQRGGKLGIRRAIDADLSHMADVKQACFRACMVVFCHNARVVLHRHFVSGETNHLSAQLFMQRMERRLQQRAHAEHPLGQMFRI